MPLQIIRFAEDQSRIQADLPVHQSRAAGDMAEWDHAAAEFVSHESVDFAQVENFEI